MTHLAPNSSSRSGPLRTVTNKRPLTRSETMARVRGRDTAPELHVRRALWRQGFRHRLGGCGLPGRPDLAYLARRVAVFVHGCFWHAHDCARGARTPKANAAYWSAKIARNRERDAASLSALAAQGSTAIVIWECALADGVAQAAATLRAHPLPL